MQVSCNPEIPPTRAGIAQSADAAAAEPDGGPANTAKLTVSITPTNRPQTHTLQVNFTVGGTATRGDDYTLSCAMGCPANGKKDTITIPAGSMSADITITALPDAISDPGDTVVITLNETDPEGTAYYLLNDTKASAFVTIADHVPLQVTVAASDGSATEGDDTDQAQFTISRNSVATNAMTVQFTIAGDATKGTDYDDPGTSKTIPAGQSTVVVAIKTRQDTQIEGTETVTLTLAGTPPPDHTFGPPATVAIFDDDLPTVKVIPTASSVIEGTSAASSPGFRFERTATAGALAVQYTVSGSAVSDVDYAALTGEVDFAAGEASKLVPVVTLQDAIAEPLETVTVQIAASGDYQAGLPTQATVSIEDDDQPTVAITVLQENAFEKINGQTRSAVLNLTRSAAGRSAALTVQITATGTATAADYAALPTSVTFPPGKGYVLLEVKPIDDAVAEAPETVTVTIQTGPYAIAAPGFGRVFINDDDGVAAGEDGDGIPASRDNCPSATNPDQLDSDSDTLGDACDPDDDNDGLSDDDERRNGTSATSADTDQDGLSDQTEVAAGTDPTDRFSPDYRARDVTANATNRSVLVSWESPSGSRADRFQVWRLSEPTLLAVVPAVPGQVLYSYEDMGFPGGLHTYFVQAKLPGEDDAVFDADAATAAPAFEAALCEVRTADQDGDGLCDALEQQMKTNLYDADSDGDGVTDGAEVEAGTDPLAAPEAESSHTNSLFDEPLMWLGVALLALLVAGLVVGLVRNGRGR